MAPPLNRRTRVQKSAPQVEEVGQQQLDFNHAAAPKTGRFLRAMRFISGALVLGALSSAGALCLRSYATTSPRLTIKKIEVQGARVRKADVIAAESGVHEGDNIFRVDPDSTRRALLKDPWLGEVIITRELPSTIRIAVKERQAALMVALERVYLATAEGQIFKPLEATDPQELPLVVGLTLDRFTADRAGAERLIRQASELTAAYADSALDKKYPLQEIHFATDEAMSAVVGKDGLTLRLGSPPFRRKLVQAARVIDETERRSNRADLVLLDNEARPDRIVVRMR